MTRNILVTGLIVFLLGCGSTTSKPDVAAEAPPGETSDLSWSESKSRKARVNDVKYALSVKLNEVDLKFSGTNLMDFDLKDASKSLRIDFFEGQIIRLAVNGRDVPATAKKKYHIEIPSQFLQAGANRVEIDFIQEYSRQGAGLHRFEDPQTKEVFLYSDFEPYDANRLFPCFDQPDLRASLTLKVEAPASWIVIANETESTITAASDKRKIWTFPPTPPIASYIYALHAGPYQVWKDEVQGIPLRLLARPSMAKYVRVKEFFTYTKQGFKYFNAFFGLKYPFKKYDQIFVPEFNSGAMENVAAVTFNESFLTRATPTLEQRRNIAGTLLHEMAHMWFGDLVTMSWWNDLWLNESFATLMSTMAMHEATEFKDAWQDFFFDMKDWAYWEDSLVTTHPIEAPVLNVKDAFAIFDGITYGKGAAVLKQLRYFIGEDAFKKGIQLYMRTHAYKNTELKDFIAALQSKTDKDLSAWAAVWLRQSGTDSVAAEWTCTDSKLNQITLNTKSSAGAQFRPQSVQVGLFKRVKGEVKRTHSVRVDIQAPVQKLDGNWPCPDFVYPNDHDYGYLAVILDTKSLSFAQRHLTAINDRLLRTMIWNDMWEMVRNGEMPLQNYAEIVDAQLPKETDILTLASVVETLAGRGSERGSMLQYWPAGRDTEFKAFIKKTENIYLSRFNAAKAGSDDQKFWFDSYVALARTGPALAQLGEWFKVKDISPGFPLDMDRRWNVLRQIARFGSEPPSAPMEELKKTDTSDRGVRNALATEAIQPRAGIKQRWMTELTQVKPNYSLVQARAVMGTLFPLEQAELARPFDETFYSFVRDRARPEHDTYMRQFASRLVPLNCDSKQSVTLKSFIEKQKLTPAVMKALKMNLQEDERCQMIRQKALI